MPIKSEIKPQSIELSNAHTGERPSIPLSTSVQRSDHTLSCEEPQLDMHTQLKQTVAGAAESLSFWLGALLFSSIPLNPFGWLATGLFFGERCRCCCGFHCVRPGKLMSGGPSVNLHVLKRLKTLLHCGLFFNVLVVCGACFGAYRYAIFFEDLFCQALLDGVEYVIHVVQEEIEPTFPFLCMNLCRHGFISNSSTFACTDPECVAMPITRLQESASTWVQEVRQQTSENPALKISMVFMCLMLAGTILGANVFVSFRLLRQSSTLLKYVPQLQQLHVVRNGVSMPLKHVLQEMCIQAREPYESRFSCDVKELVTGEPEDAALGLHSFLGIDFCTLYGQMARGTAAIVDEFNLHGSKEDQQLLHYILHERAGSWAKTFPNGVIDQTRVGESLADFLAHESSRRAMLSEPHVVALRLYTTAAFASLNKSLRSSATASRSNFAVTLSFLNDGIKRLRAVGARSGSGHMPLDLWRGFKNVQPGSSFFIVGGTEQALCSTTSSFDVAVQYASSTSPLLFKVLTSSFMERGADVSFLSCFPEEHEILFPPQTYFRPTGRQETVTVANGPLFTVVEVVPHFPT